MRRLVLVLLAAALLVPLSARPVVVVTAPPHVAELAAQSGAAYTWHGYNTAYCPTVSTIGCGSSSLWEAELHVAVWANGTSVVMASGSGYPWCDVQGYEVSQTNCHWWGGGGEVYAAVSWQNCLLVFSLGCVSDTLTVGINGSGRVNYWHPAWADWYP